MHTDKIDPPSLNEIILLFKNEFEPILDKFEIISVLGEGESFDRNSILKATHFFNGEDIIWHPGVYLFYADGHPYRVGRHFDNSRKRVIAHIDCSTHNENFSVADLNDFPDAQILLFM